MKLFQKMSGGLWDFFGFIFSTDILKTNIVRHSQQALGKNMLIINSNEFQNTDFEIKNLVSNCNNIWI